MRAVDPTLSGGYDPPSRHGFINPGGFPRSFLGLVAQPLFSPSPITSTGLGVLLDELTTGLVYTIWLIDCIQLALCVLLRGPS